MEVDQFERNVNLSLAAGAGYSKMTDAHSLSSPKSATHRSI
jgi:hypothetical protein